MIKDKLLVDDEAVRYVRHAHIGQGKRDNRTCLIAKYQSIVSLKQDIPRSVWLDIDDWLQHVIGLRDDEVFGLSYDYLGNAVYVKLRNIEVCEPDIPSTGGTQEFRHSTGEVSNVTKSFAVLGLRTVKVYNLPVELPLDSIKCALEPYGHVLQVTTDKWSGSMYFKVDNGVRNVRNDRKKHLHIHLYCASHHMVCGGGYLVPNKVILFPIPLANGAWKKGLSKLFRTRPDLSYLVFTVPTRDVRRRKQNVSAFRLKSRIFKLW